MLVYLDLLKNFLESHANEGRAAKMKKYMRNLFDFYGVPSSERKNFYAGLIKEIGKPEFGELDKFIRKLWQLSQREYQYFALELAEKQKKRITPETLNLYEYMIVNKSWWDTVDFIAANLVGKYFLKFSEKKELKCREWIESGNIWLQRTVILFQLKYKEKTDFNLLTDVIEKLSSSKDFFIRKAIGWALREHSKIFPETVVRYVKQNYDILSPLTIREALKLIKKDGVKNPIP